MAPTAEVVRHLIRMPPGRGVLGMSKQKDTPRVHPCHREITSLGLSIHQGEMEEVAGEMEVRVSPGCCLLDKWFGTPNHCKRGTFGT